MICPCKGCTKRKIGCHGKCIEFEDWQIYHKAVKEDLREHGALYFSDQALRAHWEHVKRMNRKHTCNK